MKIGGHPTSFLVKYFEISQIPTRVFVLVKSEFYKNMGYLCAVFTTAGCCVYTSRHPLSLFTVIAEKIRITCVQFTHCYQVFPFSVKFSLIYPHLVYGNIFWGNNYKTGQDSLIKTQKKVVLVITFSSYTESSKPLIQKLDM